MLLRNPGATEPTSIGSSLGKEPNKDENVYQFNFRKLSLHMWLLKGINFVPYVILTVLKFGDPFIIHLPYIVPEYWHGDEYCNAVMRNLF